MCQCQQTATAEQQQGVVENRLLPKAYTILAIERHTELEWNFRVSRDFDVKPAQYPYEGFFINTDAGEFAETVEIIIKFPVTNGLRINVDNR